MSERRYVGLKSDPEHRKWIGKDWDLLGAYQLCFLIQMGLSVALSGVADS